MVAVNKIDAARVPTRPRSAAAIEYGLVPGVYLAVTRCRDISAKQGTNIEALEEAVSY